MTSSNAKTIKNIIKNTLTSPTTVAAIKKYNLEKFVYSTLPPEKYISGKIRSVEVSIQVLKYNSLLQPVLKSIPNRSGAHPGKGIPSKQALVEELYGLNRYRRELIEKADFSYMEQAIKMARETKKPTDINKMMKIKKDDEAAKKAEAKRQEKEAREAEFAAKVENAIKASPDETFGAAVVDLTLAPKDFDFSSLSLPMADNALMCLAVNPKDMKKAMDVIDLWQFSYIDNAVWNRDFSKSGSDWCDNKHTMLLIATKGTPEEPVKGFRLASVYYERQTLDTIYIPEYYYDMIEQMCPGQQYLEVFSHRQHSDSWHVLDTNFNNN